MAAKGSYKRPLEWIYYGMPDNEGGSAVRTDRIELGLKDDEVAELWEIQGSVQNPPLIEGSDIDRTVDIALSMDPDAQNDPSDNAQLDDLEIFYSTFNDETMLSAAAADFFYMAHNRRAFKFKWFPYPVLLGTDVGLLSTCDADANYVVEVRLFFTRRRANVSELNQILLKRR